jgi:predicted O-methyltransferase YrrM
VSEPRRGPDDAPLLWTFLARGIAERVVRPALRPALEDFQREAQTQSTDGPEVLRAATGLGSPAVDSIFEEGRSTFRALPDQAVVGSAWRKDWRMELDHAAVLYALVRIRKPSVVVETGIADGLSSRVLLTALAANGSGRLVSLDVRPGTGGLVPPELRVAWRPVIVDPRRSIEGLTELLRSEAPIDLFLHDSRHTYGHMLREYRAAWPCLRPGGLLLSDDADSTFAFLDFAKAQRLPVIAYVGSRKVFGLLPKPGGAAKG